MVEKMVERRQYPRVDANIRGRLTLADGKVFNVVVCDTSSSGLRIQCGPREREMITPRGRCIESGHAIEAEIEIDMPGSSGSKKVSKLNTRCALAFSRRVAADKFHIGMSYLDLDDENYEKLAAFIDVHLKREA